MSGEICLILTTVDSEDAARQMARSLVEQRLAGCVQMLPGIRSLYRWQGSVEEAGESLIQIKTSPERANEVMRWLEAHHPYELPEIVRIDASASAAYAAWLAGAAAIQESEHD
ncbi:MAG TPA: divalent-cation tolerance protein CutA [Mariprofundaceae bacterium]|nr:divalent-cation tolerance protein CutA [Mariprofundaceae bacterium]